jgi:hypothetical protein
MFNAAAPLAVCVAMSSILSAAAFSPTYSRHGVPTKPTTSTSLKLGDFFNNFGKSDNKEEAAPVAEQTKQIAEEEYYDEDDPIEKIFGVFFGKKEVRIFCKLISTSYFTVLTLAPEKSNGHGEVWAETLSRAVSSNGR